MGEIVNGRYISDTESAVLDALMADAKEQLGEDLNDDEAAVIRMFYIPVAKRFVELQNDLGLILDSAQIEHAEGAALSLLTALIGVPRQEARTATGEVEITLDSPDTVAHNIPSGTTVATNSEDAVRFVVTDGRTLEAGTTEVTAPIEAEEGGVDSNVGSNTISVFPDGKPFPGASVINPQQTSGGTDAETDEELRSRAKQELANGARATGPALVSQTLSIDGVTDATILINDTPNDNGRGYGLPSHSFEIVATTDGTDATHKKLAQVLMETKSVGDISVTAENGDSLDTNKEFVTADGEIMTDLPNGQQHPVGFSLSSSLDIYVDIDIKTESGYAGDDAVRDAIVEYIGGFTSTGAEESGELGTGEEVVHASLEKAVMSVTGVYDINHVYAGTSSGPTSENNVSVANYEQAITDARPSADLLTVEVN